MKKTRLSKDILLSEGGYVATDLINTQALVSTVAFIQALAANQAFIDEISAKLITTENIEGLNLHFQQGKIGDWQIQGGGIVNNDGNAYIIGRESLLGGKEVAAYIGANVLPATSGLKAPALFRNTETNAFSDNRAAIFEASGGANNYAIDVLSGGIRVDGKNGKNVSYFEIKTEVTSHPMLGSGVRWIGFEFTDGVLTKITTRIP